LSTWGTNRTATTVNMQSMFYDASALTTLNLTDFKTTNVTTMSYMFYSAQALKTLNLANWDTASLTSNTSMFANTSNLWQITLGEKIKFSGTPGFANAPAVGTTFTDDGQTYQVTKSSWQAVGDGSVHNPTGDLVTTTQMYADRTTPVTYVWANKGQSEPRIISVDDINFGEVNLNNTA
ncbi:BspA family leucine-rich repeat surface protein, partial [Leuconostoc falkenbergense]|uniref:BspA family leucine-rich repeat surface protein n=1 Tax=Leuconostoc falkenbergense TaxID=2766470 RepID=UPI0024AD473D